MDTCPRCAKTEVQDAERCPDCGFRLALWRTTPAPVKGVDETEPNDVQLQPLRSKWHMLLRVPENPDWGTWAAKLLLLIGLSLWSCYFLTLSLESNEIGRSWLHTINLVFHEAGHVFMMPFGEFLMYLGGAAFQILLPLGLALAFLLHNRDPFGAAVCAWWAAQNCMDVAPYIADARAVQLTLLGGSTGADNPGFHDWRNILQICGMLEYDVRIAKVVDGFGRIGMLVALLWGYSLLRREYRALCSDRD